MMSSTEAQNPKISLWAYVVWIVTTANIFLIWLGWFPWFGGTEQHAGIEDKLFGQVRFGGFPADVAWLCLSTGALFLAGWFFILQARESRNARISAGLCVAEVLSFAMLVRHLYVSGRIWPG